MTDSSHWHQCHAQRTADGWNIPACRKCGWNSPGHICRDGVDAMLTARRLHGQTAS